MKSTVFAAAIVACAGAATAGGVDVVAEYAIHDHPNGNLNPPPYALRMDGAWGISNLTLSADVHNDATLTVSQDTGSGQFFIDIAGTFHGGEDIGAGWDSPFDVEVAMSYQVNVTAIADGWIVDGFSVLNSGSFTRLDTNEMITWYGLEDASGANGPAGETFHFASDGWRIDGDDSSWVGRGWLTPNFDGSPLGSGSQDWIFTAELIPAPSGLALLGLAGLAGTRRRR